MGEGEGLLQSMLSCHRLQTSSHLLLCKFRPTGFIGSLPTENIIMFTVGYGHCNYRSQKYISTTLLRSSAKRETHTLYCILSAWPYMLLESFLEIILTMFTYSFRLRSMFLLSLYLCKGAYMLYSYWNIPLWEYS